MFLPKIFTIYLHTQGFSAVTVKNYLSDLNHFLGWLELSLKTQNLPFSPDEPAYLNRYFNQNLVSRYRSYLTSNKLPYSTVNRRLSTLRTFAKFCLNQGWIRENPTKEISNLNRGQKTDDGRQTVEDGKEKTIEKFRNYLEVQKTSGGRSTSSNTIKNYLSDVREFLHSQSSIPVFRQYLAMKGISGASLKRKESSLRRFCNWAVSVRYLKENPLEDKTKKRFTLSLSKGYRALPYVTYFNFVILIVFGVALGWGIHQQFFAKPQTPLAYPNAPVTPNRYLSFQGRLTNASDTPITEATNMRFRLYDAVGTGNPPTGGNVLWDSGNCSIQPDQNGIFSTILGSTCGGAIASSVFTENANVWLGVTAGTDSEAYPRIQIATVAYALNAETLQGLPLGSTTNANPLATMGATARTIPGINPAGNLVIAAASPTIWSTSGTFAIRGQVLSIITDTGTNGNITLAPDGSGVLNLTLSAGTGNVINATDANLGSSGGKEANTLYYGKVANNNTNVNLLKLESGSSPTPKFTVDYAGNASASGYLRANTTGSYFTGDITVSGGDITGTSGSLDIGETNSNYIISSTGLAVGGTTTYYLNSTGTLNVATINAFNLAGNMTVNQDVDLIPAGTTGTNDLGSSAYPWDNLYAVSATLSGILALGPNAPAYAGTCNASNKGKQYYDGTDNTMYYCNGTSWVSMAAGGAGSGYWQRNSGALAPGNITDDVLIGGTATTSAKFAFLNTWGGTPVASISGNLVLASTAGTTRTIGATNMNPLILGTATTSDLQFYSSSNKLTSAGALTLASTITANTTDTINGLSINAASITDAVNLNMTGYATTSSSLAVGYSTMLAGVGNGVFAGRVGIGTSSPTQALDVSGNATVSGNLTFYGGARTIGATNMNNLTIGGASTGNIILNPSNAVAGGAILPNTTNVTDLGTASLQFRNIYGQTVYSGGVAVSNYWTQANGTLYPNISSLDLLIGGTSTSSAKFAFTNVLTGTPTATFSGNLVLASTAGTTRSISATNMNPLMIGGTTTGNIQLAAGSATPAFVLTTAGQVGIGTTAPDTYARLTITAGNNSWLDGIHIYPDLDSPSNSAYGVAYSATATVNATNTSFIAANNEITLAASGQSAYGANNTLYAANDGSSQLLYGAYNLLRTYDVTDYAYGVKNISSGSSTGGSIYGLYNDFSSGTATKWGIYSTGETKNYFSGNVGIGTTAPLAKLDISGDASMSGNLYMSSSIRPANSPLSFDYKSGVNSWATAMTIANTGNVGIGTTNPGVPLEINTGTLTSPYYVIKFNGNGEVSNDTGIGHPEDSVISLITSGVERLRVHTGGNVGIGTTAPTATLDIAGDASTSGSLVLRGTSPATIDILNGARLYFQTSVGGDTGLTPRMTITNAGRVGIGTTNPGNAKLDVIASGGSYGIYGETGDGVGVFGNATTTGGVGVYGGSTGTGYAIEGYNPDATGFAGYFTGRGYFSDNVGIGAQSPISKLHVSGTTTGKALAIFNETGGNDILTASASGATVMTLSNAGILSATRFADTANTSYFLDPANASSLNLAGYATISGSLAVGYSSVQAGLGNAAFAGNVGIGTTAPDAPLEINTGSLSSPYYVIKFNGNGEVANDTGIGHPEDSAVSLITSGTERLRVATGGKVGIGTTNPSALLSVGSTSQFQVSTLGAVTAVGVNSGSGLIQGTGGLTVSGNTTLSATAGNTVNIGNSTGALTLASGGTSAWTNTSGNLTISTATSGTLALTSAEALNLSAGAASTWALPAVANALNIDSNTLTIDALNDRVGIGTTSPDSQLTISQSLGSVPVTALHFNPSAISDGGGFSIDFRTTGTQTANRYVARISGIREAAGALSTLAFSTETGSALTEKMRITSAGRVGIGTTSPGTILAVVGLTSSQAGRTICSDTSGNFYYYAGACVASSIKYKENITALLDQSDQLFQLRPVKFNYKDTGEEDIGLIAEEVAPIFPDLVYYNNGEISGVKYEKLPLYLWQAMKKQQEQIASLSTTLGQITEATVVNLKAGFIQTQELIANNITTNNLTINNKLVSPLVETDQLIAKESQFGKILADNVQTNNIATNNITIENDATISGTLYADEIVTKHGKFGDLMANQVTVATISAQYITYVTNITQTIEPTSTPLRQDSAGQAPIPTPALSEAEGPTATPTPDLTLPGATESASLADLASSWPVSDPSQDLKITGNVRILGRTSLANTSVAGQLVVDGTVIIDSQGLSSLPSSVLRLQSSGQGGIDILAGKVVIDIDGNVQVAGNLAVGGNLSAATLHLGGVPSATSEVTGTGSSDGGNGFGKLLEIQNPLGETLASIDASGSATFAEVKTNQLMITSDYSATQSAILAQIQTNATSGIGILPAGQTEFTIFNPKVSNNTLIYITPATTTQNKVLYVSAKKENEYFKVAIDTLINQDIKFNWWIIN